MKTYRFYDNIFETKRDCEKVIEEYLANELCNCDDLPGPCEIIVKILEP